MPNSEYDISEYTDKDLYDILDLVNPSDRELEAKILMKIREYNISNGDGKNDGIIDFLNQIYTFCLQHILHYELRKHCFLKN
jgi:hypothetical protein